MNKLSRFFKNPLVTTLPVVITLIFLWQQHTTALTQVDVPASNILSNGNFEQWDNKGLPEGWQVKSTDGSASTNRRTGYDSASLLAVNTSGTPQTSTEVASPSASVHSGVRYFYKGYYMSSVPFELILETTFQDGTHQRTLVGRYEPSATWATVAYLFTNDSTTQSVRLIYSFSAKGELQIDHCYMEPNPQNVYQTSRPQPTQNLLHNAALTSSDGVTPDGWSNYTAGDQKASFGYVNENNTPYLHTQTSDYKSGEAKWQYDPVPVTPNHLLQFQVTYQSDTTAQVVAEYVLTSGTRKFHSLTDLLPAKEWTNYSGTVEVPSDATNLFVSVVLHTNGIVNTKSYALYDITKAGDTTWQQPIISYAFDDGWQSAYTNAIKPLSEAGYKATFYLNPSSIDTPQFMTSDEVQQLQNHGYELASHGYEHRDLTTLAPDAAEQQAEKAYRYLNQTHSLKAASFAAPYGMSNPQVEYIARKYYTSLRGTTTGINTKQNFNPFNLSIVYVGSDMPIAKLTAMIAETKARHGWLIIVYHRVETGANVEAAITPTQFQQQLEAVRESGVVVKTVQAALQEVSSQ
jgi:peptidoglycan/xylan/chitin deacetylase (PgdA/CDA1 family)